MKTRKQTEFVPAKPHAKVTTGEVIRMLRELKGWLSIALTNPPYFWCCLFVFYFYMAIVKATKLRTIG